MKKKFSLKESFGSMESSWDDVIVALEDKEPVNVLIASQGFGSSTTSAFNIALKPRTVGMDNNSIKVLIQDGGIRIFEKDLVENPYVESPNSMFTHYLMRTNSFTITFVFKN